MLRAMIQLAAQRQTKAHPSPGATHELRRIADFPEAGDRAYVVQMTSSGTLGATAFEVDATTRYRFPFRRPSGPRSPQIGPVLKRSYDPKKGVMPNATTLSTTFAHFEALAQSSDPVAGVYRRALAALVLRRRESEGLIVRCTSPRGVRSPRRATARLRRPSWRGSRLARQPFTFPATEY